MPPPPPIPVQLSTGLGQTHNNNINPVFKRQKNTVRAISFQPTSSLLLPSSKLLNFSKYFISLNLKLLIFVFDPIHGNLPYSFNYFFLLGFSVYHYFTRQVGRGDMFLLKSREFWGGSAPFH